MKKTGLVGLILVLAMFLAVGITHAATWTVGFGGFFATIQLAHDSVLVHNGDTLQILGEGLIEQPTMTIITKTLTIRGNGVGKTLLTSSDGIVFWIFGAVNTRITNMTIMGQPADPLDYAIIVWNGSGITVDYCTIQYCTIGIVIDGGTNHKIAHNTIRWSSCLNDIGGMQGTGIYLYSATSFILTNTTVNANYIYDNDGVGVAVYGNKAVNASVNGIKILSNFFSNNSAFNACSFGGINYNLESINLWYNNGVVTVNNNKFLYPIEDGPGSVLGDWHSLPGLLSKTGNTVYYGQKISFSGPSEPLP